MSDGFIDFDSLVRKQKSEYVIDFAPKTIKSRFYLLWKQPTSEWITNLRQQCRDTDGELDVNRFYEELGDYCVPGWKNFKLAEIDLCNLFLADDAVGVELKKVVQENGWEQGIPFHTKTLRSLMRVSLTFKNRIDELSANLGLVKQAKESREKKDLDGMSGTGDGEET